MAEHLSKLILDELAAGLPVADDARTHASDCADCEQRLAKISAARSAAKASPRFEQTFASLLNAPTVSSPDGDGAPAGSSARRDRTKRPLWSWPRLLAFAPALAVALVLVVLTRTKAPQEQAQQESHRIKGSAALSVLRAPEGTPVSSARVGDRVVIAVSSAEPFGIVFAVSERGEIDQVWPSGIPRSERLGSGGETRLEPGFTVTPGSVMLHAFFSQTPLDAQAVRDHLQNELELAKRSQHAPVTPLDGAARAAMLLSVEAGK